MIILSLAARLYDKVFEYHVSHMIKIGGSWESFSWYHLLDGFQVSDPTLCICPLTMAEHYTNLKHIN